MPKKHKSWNEQLTKQCTINHPKISNKTNCKTPMSLTTSEHTIGTHINVDQQQSDSQSNTQHLRKIPQHIAIIMDGNARWAKQNGKTIAEGHYAGYKNIERVVRILRNKGVAETTLFAFSTENWHRPDKEVESIMALASEAVAEGAEQFHKEGIKLRHIGSGNRLDKEMREKIAQAVATTASNHSFTLNLAFDYGGREDIVNAARRLVAERIDPEDIDEAMFSKYLYTSGGSDPDLVIRTGGEFRISNFMIWQSAYSEFHSTNTLWPAFSESDIDQAIEIFASRQRRFGLRIE